MESIFYSVKNPKLILWIVMAMVVVLFYDSLWDLLLSLFHALGMFLHFMYEFSEHALHLFIEHFFHTDPRTTQIIVFYVMAVIIAFILLKVLMALPKYYCRICDQVTDYWQHEKAKAINKWQSQSLTEKIKWLSVFIFSSFFMSFWLLS